MNENDTIIRQLFEKLNSKKVEIQKAERPKWNTNLSFRFDEDKADHVNIAVITDVKKLVELAAFLIGKENNWKAANTALGLKEPFKWLNRTPKEWFEDFRTRIDQIQISKKKEEFAALEAKLNMLVSPEERRRIEIEEIQKALENE